MHRQLHRAFAINTALERHILNTSALNRSIAESQLQWIDRLDAANRNFLAPLGIVANIVHATLYLRIRELSKSPLAVFSRALTTSNMIILPVYLLNFVKYEQAGSALISQSDLACKLASYVICLYTAFFSWTLLGVTVFTHAAFRVGGLSHTANTVLGEETTVTRETIVMGVMSSSRPEVASNRNECFEPERRRAAMPTDAARLLAILVLLAAVYSYNLVFMAQLETDGSSIQSCGISSADRGEGEFKTLLLTIYCIDFVVVFLAPFLLVVSRTALIIRDLSAYLRKREQCGRRMRNERATRRNMLAFHLVVRPVMFGMLLLPIHLVVFVNCYYLDASVESEWTTLYLKLIFSILFTINISLHACFIVIAFLLNKKFRRVLIKFVRKAKCRT